MTQDTSINDACIYGTRTDDTLESPFMSADGFINKYKVVNNNNAININFNSYDMIKSDHNVKTLAMKSKNGEDPPDRIYIDGRDMATLLSKTINSVAYIQLVNDFVNNMPGTAGIYFTWTYAPTVALQEDYWFGHDIWNITLQPIAVVDIPDVAAIVTIDVAQHQEIDVDGVPDGNDEGGASAYGRIVVRCMDGGDDIPTAPDGRRRRKGLQQKYVRNQFECGVDFETLLNKFQFQNGDNIRNIIPNNTLIQTIGNIGDIRNYNLVFFPGHSS